MNIHPDAFSSGQIQSKLWLCEELEKLFDQIDVIYVYGGWYGVLPFLIRTRNNIKVQKIRSFDLDPYCEYAADTLNENWKWQDWQFKSITQDCNTVDPSEADLIINTSTEHFRSRDWWHNIPKGKFVVLQSNNMSHDDHVESFDSAHEFLIEYPMSEILYTGKLDFTYPEWSFSRVMLIGKK